MGQKADKMDGNGRTAKQQESSSLQNEILLPAADQNQTLATNNGMTLNDSPKEDSKKAAAESPPSSARSNKSSVSSTLVFRGEDPQKILDTIQTRRERSISYMREGGLYANQARLPRLPVPPLAATGERYLALARLLHRHQDDPAGAAQEATEQAVRQFLDGEGPKLQAKLLEYRETVDNFVDEFWSDAYFVPECPLPINVNPYFLLEEDPTPGRNDQVGRASSLVYSALRFVGELWNNSLRPDVVKGTPLCMSQYPKLFGTARIPNSTRDDPFNPEHYSQHVVVLSRGQFYYFDVLDDKGNIALSEAGIAKTLAAIIEDSGKLKKDERAISSIGALTSEHRRVWARFRADLGAAGPHNRRMLAVVDAALFVLCLDDVAPAGPDQAAAYCLHGSYALSGENGDIQVGTLTNRWYDKINIIVFQDGTAGINFEHSQVDGHTVLRMASDVFADTIVRFAQSITRTIYGTDYVNSVFALSEKSQKQLPSLCHPRKIEWELTQDLRERVFYAETRASDAALRVDHRVLEYHGYGKDWITKHNLSPDAFLQMSILVAYCKLFGEVPNIYESVQTKHFLRGRTEAGRTLTEEALAFARAWCTLGAPAATKIKALRLACAAHSNMVKRCSKGHGVDRHLFALKCMKEKFFPEDPMPAIFTDKAYQLLNHNTISTSNCGNPSLRHFGFGPVVDDGFGVGYVIKESALHFAVSSKHRQTQRFLATIERYLGEVHDLLEQKTAVVVQPRTAQGLLCPDLQRKLSARSGGPPSPPPPPGKGGGGGGGGEGEKGSDDGEGVSPVLPLARDESVYQGYGMWGDDLG